MDDDVEIIKDEDDESAKDKLKKLRGDLMACKKERDDYLAGWQRAKADFINARKDEEKARMEFAKFAAEVVLGEMLAVADSLELAGEKPVYAQLRDIFKKQSVEPIEANGRKFDPMYHEALETVPIDDESKDGIVLKEMQKGYMFHDKVLRSSKVKVGVYKIKD